MQSLITALLSVIIMKFFVDAVVITMELIVDKFIYHNALWQDIAHKLGTICPMDVLVMEVLLDITEKTIVVQQVMNT